MKEKGAVIGTFDGVHRGHRVVIDRLLEVAKERNLEPVAMTFDRHPLALIAPERAPMMLTSVSKRKKLLTDAGLSTMVFEFNEDLRQTTAEEWLKKVGKEFGVKLVVIGYDNTFGSDGLNLSVADYKEIGKRHGIEIIEAAELKDISSSAIRKAIAAGKIEEAHSMLGRPYSLAGEVVSGNHIGRQLGFPTANIRLTPGIAVPPEGVYAAIAKLSDGSEHTAMINIGRRPTVADNKEITIETHLIDWDGDLYGKEIILKFLSRIRDERKFENLEALRHQLEKDRLEVLKLKSSVNKLGK